MLLSDLQKELPVRAARELSDATGVSIYLVGGAVRDSLLDNARPGDCDLVVAGQLEEIVRQFARRVRGHAIPWDFNQVRVVYRDSGKQHVTVDFALAKGAAIEDDLRLRDFTVNAMAVDVRDAASGAVPPVIDPLNGRSDLNNKIIRMCSGQAFEDDPLRMLRALRFARQLGFAIDGATLERCSALHGLIGRVSVERVKKELFTILGLPRPGLSLRQLAQTGLLQDLIPETELWRGFAQCAPHEFTLLEHCLRTADCIDAELAGASDPLRQHLAERIEEGVTRRALLLFAGLVHDSGKPAAARDMEGRPVFHGHDVKGAPLNLALGRRLGLGRRASRMIELMTRQHMRLLQLTLLDDCTDRAKLRLVHDCGEEAAEVLLLSLADMSATTADPAYGQQLEKARALAAELLDTALRQNDGRGAFPLVTGADIMAELGCAPGPQVGAVLKQLEQAERDGRIQTREEALQWLRAIQS